MPLVPVVRLSLPWVPNASFLHQALLARHVAVGSQKHLLMTNTSVVCYFRLTIFVTLLPLIVRHSRTIVEFLKP